MPGADLPTGGANESSGCRSPNAAPDDCLHKVFEPTAAAIGGLEKALPSLGLLEDALALDLRRQQDH